MNCAPPENIRTNSAGSIRSVSETTPSSQNVKTESKVTKPKGPTLAEQARDEFPDMSVEQIFYKTKTAIEQLHNLKVFNDSTCDSYLVTCKWFSHFSVSTFRHRNTEFSDLLAENNYVDIFLEVWRQNFICPFLEETGKEYCARMRNTLVAMWNGTDSSKKLCEKMKGNIVEIFKYLDSPMFDPSSDIVRIKTNYEYLTKGLMGVLTNIIRFLDVWNLYRENDGVRIFQKLQKSDNRMIQVKALRLLAHIMTDKESELIAADTKHINFLVAILKTSHGTENHFGKRYGYTVAEMMEFINLMASHDKNKKIIVQNEHALNIYIDVLKDPHNIEEQRVAATGLWSFSFKCKDTLLAREDFIQLLQDLKLNSKTDEVVQKSVNGTLWELGLTKRDESTKKVARQDSSVKGRVMISYQWTYQTEIIELKQKLAENGYQVWLDIEQMSGDILDAMAEAVETSDVVLVCYSNQYKSSPNCRSEASYANNKRKNIVPVRMQFKYVADGWLGLVISTRLFIDYSTEEKRAANFSKLVVELDKMIKSDRVDASMIVPTQNVTISAAPPPRPAPHPALTAAPLTGTTVYPGLTSESNCKAAKWKVKEVSTWLKENLPGETHMKFQGYDGAALMELLNILSTVPDFYYKSVKDDLNLNLLETLHFTQALRKL